MKYLAATILTAYYAFTQALAIAFTFWMQPNTTSGYVEETTSLTTGDPADPINILNIALYIAAVSALILIARYLNIIEIIRKYLPYVLNTKTVSIAGAAAFLYTYWMDGLGEAVGLVAVMALAGAAVYVLFRGFDWPIHNLKTSLLAAYGGALIGLMLSPEIMIGLLLVMIVYDVVSVYFSGHMQLLADTLVDTGLPFVYVAPKENLRLGWLERSDGGLEGMDRWGLLGAGDAAIPAAFMASVYVGVGVASAALVLLGGIIGLTAMYVYMEYRGGVHAGLPPICGGCLAGFGLAVIA